MAKTSAELIQRMAFLFADTLWLQAVHWAGTCVSTQEMRVTVVAQMGPFLDEEQCFCAMGTEKW